MCGHVGVAGKLRYHDEAIFKRLLLFDYLRGKDSTGAAFIKDNGEALISKIASHPIDLMDLKSFSSNLSYYDRSAFIGHNRAATKGKVNGANAHPFTFGHITGCHNGTLTGPSWEALEKATGEAFDSDSPAIFAAIEKLGIEETVKLLEGAWALVWYNAHEHSLNFLRNKERPFWRAYSEELDTLYWSSEYPFLRAAIDLDDQGDFFVEEEYNEKTNQSTRYSYWSTIPDMWYRIDLEELSQGYDKRPNHQVKKLEGKVPPPKKPTVPAARYAGGTPSGDPFDRATPTLTTTNNGGSNTSSSSSSDQLHDDPVWDVAYDHQPVWVKANDSDPFVNLVSRIEFEEIAKHGCSWCGEPVKYDDTGITVSVEVPFVLCAEHSKPAEGENRLYIRNVKQIIQQENK